MGGSGSSRNSRSGMASREGSKSARTWRRSVEARRPDDRTAAEWPDGRPRTPKAGPVVEASRRDREHHR